MSAHAAHYAMPSDAIQHSDSVLICGGGCFFFFSSCILERQTRHKHVLDERRCRHQILQLQIEDALQSLHAERPELGQLAQQPAEVVRLPLGVRIVGDVIA